MCPSVDYAQADPTKRTVGYYFRLGSIPLLFFVVVLLLSLFIYTGTLAPAGEDPVLSKERYQFFATWYIFIGIMGLALLALSSAMAKSKGGLTAAGQVFFLDDPHKSWKDFVAIGICTFGGLGAFVVVDAMGLQQSIDIPEPVLQLVVAGTEEFVFRFVLPVFFFLILANFHPNRDVVFFIAILFAGGVFSIFHLFAYSWALDTSAGLVGPLFAAAIAGVWGSLLFFIAVRVGAGGEWALLGLVVGHYAWNLMKLGIPSQVLVVYMFGMYVIVGFFMLILGYFDDVFKPTSHAQTQNLNRRNRLGGGARYNRTSRKNIPSKLNRKWKN